MTWYSHDRAVTIASYDIVGDIYGQSFLIGGIDRIGTSENTGFFSRCHSIALGAILRLSDVCFNLRPLFVGSNGLDQRVLGSQDTKLRQIRYQAVL